MFRFAVLAFLILPNVTAAQELDLKSKPHHHHYRHCSMADLKISNCTIQQDGEVTCRLRDAFGGSSPVQGFFQPPRGDADGEYIRHGGVITLHFVRQVSFVMDEATEQTAICLDGSWQTPARWVLPKARGVRSCHACLKASECLSTVCISGKGLRNKLWLAGSSEDSELCSDPDLCGVQQDSQCNAQPTCTAEGRTAEALVFKSKDCSNSSCNFEDCCEEQFGTCDGVCDCPWKPKMTQPTHCRGSACQKDECCVKDPTVETCSRATGGTCSFGSCFAWRGKTRCVRRSVFQHECECLPGQCARHYGKDTGICEDKCKRPEDCGPDTGGSCDRTSNTFGSNTCDSWRGQTQCVHGRCLCNKGSCAVDYGEDHGRCKSDGLTQLAETSSQDYKPKIITTLVATSAGLLATVSCLLLRMRWRYLHTSSNLKDPLLYGGCLEE